MGTKFSHFNPLSDEHGQTLVQRLRPYTLPPVYCLYIREGAEQQCFKLKIDTTIPAKSQVISQSPLQLLRYIFGEVLSTYIDHPAYKTMTEGELQEVASDFFQHLKHTCTHPSTMLDIEHERFHVQFPNNAFAKYADHSKLYFSRNITLDNKLTLYYHFPIQLVEYNPDTQTTEKYDVVIRYLGGPAP